MSRTQTTILFLAFSFLPTVLHAEGLDINEIMGALNQSKDPTPGEQMATLACDTKCRGELFATVPKTPKLSEGQQVLNGGGETIGGQQLSSAPPDPNAPPFDMAKCMTGCMAQNFPSLYKAQQQEVASGGPGGGGSPDIMMLMQLMQQSKGQGDDKGPDFSLPENLPE